MRGRWLMPKHTALAMAVRHMTGSAQVIGILNGLGHCSSHSQVLEHDTALAELQLERGGTYIPPSIVPEISVTLVWDNNDFGEETLSGKGTTHNTNGIIIQIPPVMYLSLNLYRCRKAGKGPFNLLLSKLRSLQEEKGPVQNVLGLELKLDVRSPFQCRRQKKCSSWMDWLQYIAAERCNSTTI